MPRARIGCTQRVEDLPARSERRDALDQRWSNLASRAGWTLVPIPNTLADPVAYVEGLELDLVVFSGGNDLASVPGAVGAAPERDATEARLLDHLRAQRRPALGVCRGLQLMNERAGGELVRVEGHAGTTHGIAVRDDRWPLRRGPVRSFHDWGVTEAGLGGLVALALADDGTVEAACDPVLPHVAVMWHPERAPEDEADLALIDALLESR
ncbi:MAG: hypothetical protein FJW88_08665 [Actinobacteria bacterium]|nr:hypothetical protein [Actinomycetota bacterium]